MFNTLYIVFKGCLSMGLHKQGFVLGGGHSPIRAECVNMHLGDPKVLFIIWDGVFRACVCIVGCVVFLLYLQRISIKSDRPCLHQCLELL